MGRGLSRLVHVEHTPGAVANARAGNLLVVACRGLLGVAALARRSAALRRRARPQLGSNSTSSESGKGPSQRS